MRKRSLPISSKRMAKAGSGPARARLLPRSFYSRPPEIVAREILGKLLVRPSSRKGKRGREGKPGNSAISEGDLVGRIVEVEAYFGDADPAAHAFAGKTARNWVLFGPPGHAYVYFIYGMHYCLNISCEPEGSAGCVLIRALEPLAGLEEMARRRWPGAETHSDPLCHGAASRLTSGPGRLCQAFGITRTRDNGADFTSPESALQIQDDGYTAGKVLVTQRVGIRKAAERMARYLIEDCKFVSRRTRE
jgi:DNA-3-methyladenine glycosylase